MDFIWTIFWFLPLLLGLVIFAVIFGLKGYKKGLWCSLCSLAVTAVMALASWLVAALLAGVLAEPVGNLIVGVVPSSGLVVTGFLTVVARSFAEVLVGIVIFGIVFCVLRLVGGLVLKFIKIPEPKAEGGKGLRLAGVCVRLADSVLVTLLVLLPLYGILMVGAGPAAIAVGGGTDVLENAAAHPVKYIYQYGPVAPVVNNLTTVEINNNDVNFVDVATGFGEISSHYGQVSNLAGQQVNSAVGNSLIQALREKVLNQSWCYHISMEALTEMEKLLLEPEYAKNASLKREMVAAFRMAEWEFYENADPVVRVLAIALEHNLLDALMVPGGEVPEMPEIFLEELGELLNHSNKMIGIKRVVYRNGLVYLATQNGLENPQETATTLIKYYFDNAKVPKEEYADDALSFIMVLRATTVEEMEEAFEVNPLFG